MNAWSAPAAMSSPYWNNAGKRLCAVLLVLAVSVSSARAGETGADKRRLQLLSLAFSDKLPENDNGAAYYEVLMALAMGLAAGAIGRMRQS